MSARQKYKYLFGPVASRRLGFSLGVDLIPHKTCSLDCIYCELGPTIKKTIERRTFVPPVEVLKEIERFLDSEPSPDYITLSGSGEPTLYRDLSGIIGRIKRITSIPIALITNSTLLTDRVVREEVSGVDFLLPSLDAVTEEMFERVNRPYEILRIDEIIGGLKVFRQEFSGEIWLEVVLVDGVNDRPEELERLKSVANAVNPDKIQLNTVVRPGTESDARPISRQRMEGIRDLFGSKTEVIAETSKSPPSAELESLEEKIIAIAARRPVTTDEIAVTLGLREIVVKKTLTLLLKQDRITLRRHEGREFWVAW